MDLTPFVDTVRRELAVAAEAGGAEASALAERLTAPLASAIRLALLDALSAASDEITRDLAPGSVEVRLRAGEASFAVTLPAVEQAAPVAAAAPVAPEPPLPDEEGATARINFRLPENLKARVEEAAAAQGRSVNAWLVRAASAALQPSERATPPASVSGGHRGVQRYTGWVS
ncbi:toxin-antitoxin system HicB family antitoxin [Amycolatopsis sp. w19]|uniref:toxin-antitoxin system HicB family antitoxin n=1 Tax=Amycolatopsis sp. w19 TaxID=3448134 RepID=UPI003F19DE63